MAEKGLMYKKGPTGYREDKQPKRKANEEY